MRRRRGGLARTLAAATLLALAGCDRAPDAAPTRGAAAIATIEQESGPLRATLSAPEERRVGDVIELLLEVRAAPGVVVLPTALPETLGPFALRGVAAAPDVPDGAERLHRRTIRLDTFAAGVLELPAIEIDWRDERPEIVAEDGAPREGTLTIGPLVIDVAGVLGAADAADGAEAEPEPRPLKPTTEWELPGAARRRGLRLLAALLGAGLLAGLGLVALRRLRRPPRPAPPLPADVVALAALERLRGDDLPARGEVVEHYRRLTGIVRRYLEDRFGLHAPERTTEEFLREAERSDALDPGHRATLGPFLRSADLVKFARLEPTGEECLRALDLGVAFVRATAPRPVVAEGAS